MTASRSRGQFIATVVANASLCREHFGLRFIVRDFPRTLPGQFIQIGCRDWDEFESVDREIAWPMDGPPRLTDSDTLARRATLRRPFSLAGRRNLDDGRSELYIIHRVVGVGTEWLSELRTGDEVHILGPLGNQFTLPPGDSPALLVGGGVGIPPMLYLAEYLVGRPAVAFAGALTRGLLPFTFNEASKASGVDDVTPRNDVAEFAHYGVSTVIATDDGSKGFRGFVTQALEKYLDTHSSLAPPVIYTCGPEPMMRRVADIAAARDLECQVAVERAMACGMGTCQSCCIRVKKPDPSIPPLAGRDWCWRLACTDGPVFKGAELLW